MLCCEKFYKMMEVIAFSFQKSRHLWEVFNEIRIAMHRRSVGSLVQAKPCRSSVLAVRHENDTIS